MHALGAFEEQGVRVVFRAGEGRQINVWDKVPFSVAVGVMFLASAAAAYIWLHPKAKQSKYWTVYVD